MKVLGSLIRKLPVTAITFSLMSLLLFSLSRSVASYSEPQPTDGYEAEFSNPLGEITGRVLKLDTQGVRGARVELVFGKGEHRSTHTDLFGGFRLFDIPIGENLRISISHRRYRFVPQELTMITTANVLFVASPTRTEIELDRKFGIDGKVTTDFGGNDRALSIFTQLDAKIVVVGSSNNRPAIARYLPDGKLDLSYGEGGRVISTNIVLSTDTNIKPSALQSDSKVVVGGRSSLFDFVLERRNTDGTLDKTFGNAGLVSLDFGVNSFGEVRAVAIQPDGKIIAVGTSHFGTTQAGIGVARFHLDGSLDTSFGEAGKVIVDTPNIDIARSAVVQRDGKITICGTIQNTKQMVVRLRENGSLDTDFGSRGITISPVVNLQGYDIAIQRDGKILGAGEGIARYDSSGINEPGFESGIVGLEVQTVATSVEGLILVAGRSFRVPSRGGDFGVAVIHPFTGSVIHRIDTDILALRFEDPKDMLVQADGKVIVAGFIALNSSNDFAIVQYRTY